MFNILDFLSFGNLGPIKIEISEAELIEILGAAEAVSKQSFNKNCKILKYASFQFYFDKNKKSQNRLKGIAIYFDENDQIICPKNLLLQGFVPNKGQNRIDFMKKALENNIVLNKNPELCIDNEQFALISEIGVDILFSLQNNQFMLESLQYFKH